MSIQVISFNCLLKNKVGHIISSTFNRDVLNAINHQQEVLSGLAKGLQNLTAGEKRTISLAAEEAYGLYDPKKVILFPKTSLPKNIKVNDAVTIVHKDGTRHLYKILQFFGAMVSLDGNHPLAGQDLVFEIEALSVREATRKEIDDSFNGVEAQLLH